MQLGVVHGDAQAGSHPGGALSKRIAAGNFDATGVFLRRDAQGRLEASIAPISHEDPRPRIAEHLHSIGSAVTGTVGLASITSSNWLEYASRQWSVGPGAQWNLLEGGRLRANVRVQQAREAQALKNYRQTVLVALEDTENALIAYAKEQSRRQSLGQSERANQAALELSTQLYRSGLVGFRNVLDSERTLYEAQEALVESTQSVSLDLVQLYKALGGGWERESAPVAQAEPGLRPWYATFPITQRRSSACRFRTPHVAGEPVRKTSSRRSSYLAGTRRMIKYHSFRQHHHS
ncbi:MAG TPA: TolC family protein [Steroidobacteraceae bacterium]|jgi:hypothetical protein|nr:TolC family protein [Steroidobacteraceae bacterium]